jgi:transcriptional regulator with GAF, ATPase, and Fis domain
MVLELHRQLELLNQAPSQSSAESVDFYGEVSHFEIDLIKRALRFADGHPGKAAQLLGLKATTLGAMIKR